MGKGSLSRGQKSSGTATNDNDKDKFENTQ